MDEVLYDQHACLERHHWWFTARRAIVEAVLARHLVAEGERHILDVGCGTGGMLPLLARFGRVRGLEAEESAVARCRADAVGYDVDLGIIPDDVPSDGTYDLVTAFDVIEHLVDDLGALGALTAAVRPGGSVVVTVPSLMWLWSDHDVVNGHRRRYTRAGLIDLFARSGLTLRHVSSFNTVLLPAVAASRLAQRLRPSRPGASPRSDFSMPPSLINRILARAMSVERSVVAGRGLPIGVSLVAVASRGTPTGAALERARNRSGRRRSVQARRRLSVRSPPMGGAP